MMRFFLFIFAFIVLLSGCSSDEEATQSLVNDMNTAGGESANVAQFSHDGSEHSEEMNVESERATKEEPASATESSERMVIYQGHLSVEVKNYTESEAAFQQKAEQLGGYLVESSFYEQAEGMLSGSLVVRIPKKHFHSYLTDIEQASTKLIDRQVSGRDVTEEYVDLESRLRSKRTVEERLTGFLEKATSTENLLKISNELAKVQEEIEQIVGRQNYLKENVDYSVVTIQLTEKRVQVGTLQGGESLNTWERSKKLFVDTVNALFMFFSKLAVVFIGLSPILVPLAVVAVVLRFWYKKRAKNRRHMNQSESKDPIE
jgi:hypothetical protein